MKRSTLRLPTTPLEREEQAAVIAWAGFVTVEGIEGTLADYLVASLNGATLGGDARLRALQVARLKRQGMKPGTSDLFVMIPRGRFAGLWVEMKRHGGKATDEQTKFIERARAVGDDAQVAEGADNATEIIRAYLYQGPGRVTERFNLALAVVSKRGAP